MAIIQAPQIIGTAVVGGTSKSVLFVDASGNLQQDNTNFNWDDANNILYSSIHTVGATTTSAIRFQVGTPTTADSLATAFINTEASDKKGLVIQALAGQSANMQEWQLRTGTVVAFVDAAGSLSAQTGTFTGLTSGSVLFSGAGGLVSQDNANFFWDNTNNRLGVGSTSPARQLHIFGSGQATPNITDAGNTGGTVYIQDSNGGAGNGGTILFGASQGFGAAIHSVLTNGANNTTSDIAFSVRTLATDTALTEAMRIERQGFIGIGTTAPSVQFEQSNTAVSTFTDFVGATASGSHHVISTITNAGFTSPIRNSEFDLVADLSSNPLAGKNAFACFAGTAIPSGNATTLSNLTIGGLNFNAQHQGSGALSSAFGVTGVVGQSGGGSMTNAFCLDALVLNTSGTMSNAYGVRVRNLSNSGTITQYYGVYVGTITGGTLSNTPFGFYSAEATAYNYFAGRVGIGITAPRSLLHISGATAGWVIQDEQDSNPTTSDLDANDSIAVYNKANKFVIAYNNGGTMTYVSIPLDGSTTTWTNSTTAP